MNIKITDKTNGKLNWVDLFAYAHKTIQIWLVRSEIEKKDFSPRATINFPTEKENIFITTTFTISPTSYLVTVYLDDKNGSKN